MGPDLVGMLGDIHLAMECTMLGEKRIWKNLVS